MNNTIRLAGLLGLSLVLCGAQASQVKSDDKPRQRAGSVKFLPGSQESDAARAQRLRRECRGRPNAGACLGHAS